LSGEGEKKRVSVVSLGLGLILSEDAACSTSKTLVNVRSLGRDANTAGMEEIEEDVGESN
jgi:hypothetical protein